MSSSASPRARESTRSAPSRSIDKRSVSESFPTRVTMTQSNTDRYSVDPHNQDRRSRNDSMEVGRPENNKRHSRNDSAPARRHTGESVRTPDELWLKDVMFLRKMLAINKKQEMMLNKKLARLLEEEEEFQSFAMGMERYKRVAETPKTTPPPTKEEKKEAVEERLSQSNTATERPSQASTATERNFLNSNSDHRKTHMKTARESSNHVATPEENAAQAKKSDDISLKITAVRKVEYDINGRRVFFYSDIDKESVEEEGEHRQEMKNTSDSKRVEHNSRKKGSASSKKTFTMKKSLTYINNQSKYVKKTVAKDKKKNRKEDGDSPHHDENAKNPLNFELKPKKGCQGDGDQVHNVVVRCSSVSTKESSAFRQNVKVWNYESLPSLKNEIVKGRSKNASSDQRFHKAEESGDNRRTPNSVRSRVTSVKSSNASNVNS